MSYVEGLNSASSCHKNTIKRNLQMMMMMIIIIIAVIIIKTILVIKVIIVIIALRAPLL